MRETLGPLRGALLGAHSKRGTIVILSAAVLVLGATALSSFGPLVRERSLLRRVERGDREAMFEASSGCTGGECTFFGEGPPGFACVGPDCPDAIEQRRPEIIAAVRERISGLERELAPRRLLRSRLRTLGTLWGMLFVVLFAASTFGADWRWGVWRTLLTHEPRRHRVLAGKLGATWVVVVAGFGVVAAVLVGFDAALRAATSVDAGGGPGAASLAAEAGRALLGLEVYATIAAAAATAVRGSLGGFTVPTLFLLFDALIVRRYDALRNVLPVEQVTALLPKISSNAVVSAMWVPRLTERTVCARGVCRTVPLPPIPQWRASLVLGAWLATAATAAWVALRARDVPQ